nr:probable serine/threonine protein kinase IRE [Tanacetum cinerariifolium]
MAEQFEQFDGAPIFRVGTRNGKINNDRIYQNSTLHYKLKTNFPHLDIQKRSLKQPPLSERAERFEQFDGGIDFDNMRDTGNTCGASSYGNLLDEEGDGCDNLVYKASPPIGRAMKLDDLLIQETDDDVGAIIDDTYPDLLRNLWNPSFFLEKAILAPTQEMVDIINADYAYR